MSARPPFITKLFVMQGGKCFIGGCEMTLKSGKPNTATVEHVIPKSRRNEFGKLKKRFNLKAACYSCNQRKGNKTLAEFLWEQTKEQS